MADVRERDYYTVAEAAKELDVSPSTVWRWIEARRLPAYRVGARKVRIKKDDLQLVVRPSRAPEPAAEPPDPYVFVRPSEEELARRRAVVARVRENRRRRSIAPLTSVDLIRQVREEREERIRTWLEPSS
jgi:excisionase family DNA binding protein